MEAAWDAIDTNAMAVTLDDRFAKRVGLPNSTRFPWDTERSIYYVKGIHDLHCLVGIHDDVCVHPLIASETHPESHRVKA